MSAPGTRTVDAHGNPATGPVEALARYDDAVDLLLRLDPAAVGRTRDLREDEPDVPLGHVLWGYLALSSTDRRWLGPAEEALAHLDRIATTGGLADRERAHTDALTAWAAGDWHRAAARLDDLLLRWPADVLALMMGHQLDFFLGDAHNLRDRVARSLGALDPAHDHHGLARGMLAFGLEESGDLAAAEHHGLAALDRNADDVWAVHAVAHSYEEQGRVGDGLAFLRSYEARWGGALLGVHVAWHHTLYLLEAGRHDEALALYDARLHHAGSTGTPLEMLDAAALLWRLRLDGVATGDRFAALAEAWAERLADEPWYAFNDVHLVMALAGAGRTEEARAHVERLAALADDATAAAAGGGTVGVSNARMIGEAGLPAARGLLAFAEGRPGDAVDALLPARRRLHVMGGSHAQRDVVARTLVDAALAADRLDLARALVSERLTRRPSSAYALDRQAELLRRRGDATAAATVEAAAATHRACLAQA